MIHTNSFLSFHETDRFGRRELVLNAYDNIREPLTDRKVMELCGFVDMNSVRPRITELISMGLLVEVGTQKDPLTNRHVRLTSKPMTYKQMEF